MSAKTYERKKPKVYFIHFCSNIFKFKRKLTIKLFPMSEYQSMLKYQADFYVSRFCKLYIHVLTLGWISKTKVAYEKKVC